MEDKIRAAFRLNGGMGTFIIEMNFIQCFFDAFPDLLDISVFSFSEEMSYSLYGEQYFVSAYGSRNEFVPKEYDLAIDLNWFPQVLYCDDKIIQRADENGMLCALISSWKRFAGDQRTKVYFTPDTNMFDPNIHVFATAKNQNRLQVADIDGSLGIDKHFRFTIPVEDESEVLAEFGLDNCRYITLQQGVDAACNTKFAPKQWPNEYYSRLCDICHERFPDTKLVQLGETDNNQPVEGVDLCLLGKTTIPELKAILKNSVLHVDGDCGMVHLRRAMHGGANIVLYGNLPDNVYGYNEDYRVSSDVCNHWCAKLFNAWKCRCYKGGLPECMTSIQPESIADIIEKHLDMLDNGELEIDCSLPQYKPSATVQERVLAEPEITLDAEWVNNWFMSAKIYDYVIEKVKLSDLQFSKLTSQGYRLVPLAKAPAYQYLQGDTKAYRNYMKLYQKYEPDTERSQQRFNELLNSLADNDYDDTNMIVVDGMYMILDGAHRACWLMNKYSADYEVTVLKLYRSF